MSDTQIPSVDVNSSSECKHDGCTRKAIDNTDGYCRPHFIEYKESIYLNNCDIDNLGIIQWARDLLPHYVPQKTPKFHLLILMLLLRSMHPYLKNKMERLLNIVSFRGSGKSTLCTMILPLYLLVHNGKSFTIKHDNEIFECKINEKFICIVSETGQLAEDFAVRIRDELMTNQLLKAFYKVSIQDAVDERTGQLTRKAFKFNNCFLLGIGSGMQLRGRIKGAYRVTLLIADDIYSERKVKTEIGRGQIRKWWNATVKNTVDDLMGKIWCLGTILHEDTITVDQINNPLWKTEFIRLMPLDLFREFMDKHMDINQSTGECTLPYSNVKDEYEQIKLRREYYGTIANSRDWQLAWTERIDMYMIALFVADAVRNRELSTFYQEYFHEILPDANKRFHKEQFQSLPQFSLLYTRDTVFFHCLDLYPRPMAIKMILGIDTASGTLDGDDSVLAIGGILPDNRWIVFEVIAGKFGMRDNSYINTGTDLRYGKVMLNYSDIQKIGYIDEAFRKAQQYKVSVVKVGYAGNEKTMVDETRKIFIMNNSFAMVQGRRQLSFEGAKIERIQSTLHSHYTTYSVWHNKGLAKLEHQLEYLGSAKNDDEADALEVVFSNEMPPNDELYVEEDVIKNDPGMDEARLLAMDYFKNIKKEFARN